jgi:hypothetical protein
MSLGYYLILRHTEDYRDIINEEVEDLLIVWEDGIW